MRKFEIDGFARCTGAGYRIYKVIDVRYDNRDDLYPSYLVLRNFGVTNYGSFLSSKRGVDKVIPTKSITWYSPTVKKYE